MISITKAQQQALLRKWRDHDNGMTYRQFRRSVEPIFGGDGAVVVKWWTMWLCIEPNGYVCT
jgi:hypothetical protein